MSILLCRFRLGGGMMERLTNSEKEIPTFVNNVEYWLRVYFKLKDYEDLEEQGRLVILPCKVGDTLYRVNKGAKEPVIMMRVLQLHIKQLHKDRTAIKIITINDDDMGENCYFLENIGKTVFLTQAEAEQRLKEMESD